MSAKQYFKDIKTVKAVAYQTPQSQEEACKDIVPGWVLVMAPGHFAFKKQDGELIDLEIPEDDMETLFDRGAGQDATYDNVIKKLTVGKAGLTFNPDEYEIEILDAGSKVVIEVVNDINKPCILTMSYKVDENNATIYFDMGMVTRPICKKLITWCIQTDLIPDSTWNHSGDIAAYDGAKPLHIHNMWGNFGIGQHHSVALTGFSQRPLIKFAAQRPVVLVIDHFKKVIYMVYVPLDEATVGKDKVLIMPFGVTRIPALGNEANQQLLVEVYPNPYTSKDSLPTLSNDAWTHACNLAADIKMDRPEIPQPAPQQAQRQGLYGDSSSSSSAPTSISGLEQVTTLLDNNDEKEMSIPPRVVVIYSGIPEIPYFTSKLEPDVLIKAMTTHVVYEKITTEMAGTKYIPHRNYHSKEAALDGMQLDVGDRHFPSLLPMEGGKILLAAQPVPMLNPSQVRVDRAREMIFKDTYPIFFIGAMDDNSRKVTGVQKINGLYIYQFANPGEQVIGNPDKFHTYLADINTNAATAYAGPCSITLVALTSNLPSESSSSSAPMVKYYWLDGVRQLGLFDTVPEFGADVTQQIQENLIQWLGAYRGHALVDTTKNLVNFGKESMTFQKFKDDQLANMNLDEILERELDICDVITQAQRLFDDAVLKEHANTMIAVLVKFKDAASNKIFKDLPVTTDPTYKKKLADIRGKLHQMRSSMRNLVQKLGSMISKKKMSSMKFNLAQLEKRKTVTKNVERAGNMAAEEFEELMDTLCGETGVLWLNVDTDITHHMIEQVGAKKFPMLLNEPLLPVMQYRAGDFNIDAFTIALLVSQTAESRDDPFRPQDKNKIVMSLPVSATSYGGLRQSSMFFPLLDQFSKMASPYNTKWIDLANDSDIATLRILSRATICRAAAARDVQVNIDPADNQLGWYLIYMAMASIQELIVRKGNASRYINHKAQASVKANAIVDDNAALSSSSSSSAVSVVRDDQEIKINFDDTVCINIRCMLAWILSISASGSGKPLSMVWQMFAQTPRPELPTNDFEWGVYANIVEYARYSGWDIVQLRKNVQALLARQLNRFVIKATEPLLVERKNDKIKDKTAHLEYMKKLHEVYFPHYRKIVRYCRTLRQTGEKTNPEKLKEFADVFSQFDNNQRVKSGSIYQLMMHARKEMPNQEYIDKLIDQVLFKWDNYDKNLKVKIYTFATTIKSNSAADAVESRLAQLQDELGAKRNAFLGVKAEQPISNKEHIDALLASIASQLCEIRDGHLAQFSKESFAELAGKIFTGENKFAKSYRPFDPFEHLEAVFDDEEDEAILNDDASSQSPNLENDQEEKNDENDAGVIVADPKIRYTAILGDANFTGTFRDLVMADSPDTLLQILTKASNFNSVEDYIALASFAGFGNTVDTISHKTKELLGALLDKWSMGGAESEAFVLQTIFQ
jgi:hypothetical protein